MNGTGSVTLATTNDYYGTTSVTSGTLIVSGSIGPNSPVWITGGTLRITNISPLATTNLPSLLRLPLTAARSTSMVIRRNQSLTNEPIFVAGREGRRRWGYHQYGGAVLKHSTMSR